VDVDLDHKAPLWETWILIQVPRYGKFQVSINGRDVNWASIVGDKCRKRVEFFFDKGKIVCANSEGLEFVINLAIGWDKIPLSCGISVDESIISGCNNPPTNLTGSIQQPQSPNFIFSQHRLTLRLILEGLGIVNLIAIQTVWLVYTSVPHQKGKMMYRLESQKRISSF
jgi:hypothetical protein